MSAPIITIVQELQLHQMRCYDCGRFWAKERTGNWDNETQRYTEAECPFCAARYRATFHETRRDLDRTIAALKGTITKLKRRGKR